jgi:hypothetical protein
MSTPPKDPRYRSDASADEPRQRGEPERRGSWNDGDRPSLPSWRPGAPPRAGAQPHPAATARDPARSPYAPQTASRRPAARRDALMRDLDRLEADLDARGRTDSVARMPRATQLPPVAGLAPVGEGFDAAYRPRDWLEPERLVPPEELNSRRDPRRWPLLILAAIIVAAPLGYYAFIAGSRQTPAPVAQTAPAAPVAVAPVAVAPPAAAPEPPAPLKAETDAAERSGAAETSAEGGSSARAARLPEGRLAALQPVEPASKEPPARSAARVLDAEEIRLLVKQGEQFAEAGDFSGARTLFQRAADAGDATAATALGATYDPLVLAKLGVMGIAADPEKARFWYQKAASLGSADARRRLELLGNR